MKKIPEFYKYMKFKACLLNKRTSYEKQKQRASELLVQLLPGGTVVDATVLGDFSESNKKKEEKEIIFL